MVYAQGIPEIIVCTKGLYTRRYALNNLFWIVGYVVGFGKMTLEGYMFEIDNKEAFYGIDIHLSKYPTCEDLWLC